MNKPELNAIQLGILLGITKEAALYKICKALNISSHQYIGADDKYSKAELKEACKTIKCDIQILSDSIGVNVSALMRDVKENFTKTKPCMDWLMEKIDKKLKPNKITGAYPKAIRLPSELIFLLEEPQRKQIRDILMTTYTQAFFDQHNIQVNI